MSMGARIRQLRNRFGLSGERFGELAGVTKALVSQWESDKATPTLERITELKKHADFSLDWLVYGTPEPGNYPNLSGEAIEFASEWSAMEPDRRAAYKALIDLDARGPGRK